MEKIIIKKNGRPLGSKNNRNNYELLFINITNCQYESLIKFNTFDNLNLFLASKNIHIQRQTLQNICSGKVSNDFIKIIRI